MKRVQDDGRVESRRCRDVGFMHARRAGFPIKAFGNDRNKVTPTLTLPLFIGGRELLSEARAADVDATLDSRTHGCVNPPRPPPATRCYAATGLFLRGGIKKDEKNGFPIQAFGNDRRVEIPRSLGIVVRNDKSV
jgi:hypothetical protein